jgi:two-component system, OmpR family, sensor histidine kinase VicK
MNRWKERVNRLQWKLVVIMILLILIATQLIGVYSIQKINQALKADLKMDLDNQALFLANRIKDTKVLEKNSSDQVKKKEIQERLDQLVYLNTDERSPSFTRVQVIDDQKFILASKPQLQNLVRYRNPFTFAQPDKNALVIRKIGGEDYLIHDYEIKSSVHPDDAVGVIHIEAKLNKTYDFIERISKLLIKITAVALAITSLLVVVLARTISNPIKEIKDQATAMAAGDFDRHVDVKSKDEIGQLAMAYNDLASHLRSALGRNEEEKEKLESVLANMSDGVIAADHTGKIIVKNYWAEQLLEQSIGLGQSIREILPLTETMQLPLLEERQTFLERDADKPELHTIIKVTLSPIKVHGQQMIGLVALLEDVTIQEKLERQRKDFVANVSHELRTPLTTIKSYLEALDDGAIHDAEIASRFLKVTQQEADRMTRLISDLLQLSRLDAKKPLFDKEAVQIEEILEDVVDRFSFQCKQKSIELTRSVAENLPDVYVDRDKIDQVLDNLLSNAVKYTPDRGAIAVVAKKRGDAMVEVSVADTGMGIPKQDLGRIFERFYRVDKARSRNLGGTGLGLSIAQEIIHSHGGEIGIDSLYPKGTIVWFTLPPHEREALS